MTDRATRVSLNGGDWRLRGFLGEEWRWAHLERPHPDWLPARVPGSVIDDLQRAGELADLHWERNSLATEWVPQRSWAYQKSFRTDPAWRATGGRVQLRLEGLDYEARVVLNGRRIGRHRGAFTPATFEVTDLVQETDENLLGVILAPAPDEQPQTGDTRRVRTHKPRMSYGWDFCPRIVHQGVWDDVSLRITGPTRLEELFVRPRLSADHRRADLIVSGRLDASQAGSVQLEASVSLSGRVVAHHRSVTQAVAGGTPLEVALSLAAPELWWPNGAGAQPLYRLQLTVAVDGRLSDRIATRFGVRSVELVPNDTPDPTARPYTFVVNGRRIYANGWNWVPIDACYGVPRPEKLAHLLRLAQRAQANLLRVWGGGLIERRAFYDRCDELGLMVWQEFVQSSSGIVNRPSRAAGFIAMMRDEARAIVPQRRNHPSLVLWCGGNELTDLDGTPLDDDEPVVGALHDEVRRLDPDRLWLPTSPTGREGLNTLAAIERDPDGIHDTHAPYEHQGLGRHEALYDAGTALLHSELGVEGIASLATIEATVAPEHRWPPTRDRPVWAHRSGWWINEPLVQATFGGGISDLATLIRASQYLQASGLAYAVEANRRRQWRSSGVLPWQLNEPFPMGWCTSAVDYYGRPKPAYHAVAAAYATLSLSARSATQAWGRLEAFETDVWGCSARTDAVAGRWRARLVDGRGTELAAGGGEAEVAPGSASRLGSLRWRLGTAADDLLLLALDLTDGRGALLAERRYLFSATADLAPMLRLPDTDLLVSCAGAASDGWCVTLRNAGERLALLVHLEDARPLDAPGWPEIGDDLVTLLPGEERRIDVAWPDVPAAERRLRVAGWNTAETLLG